VAEPVRPDIVVYVCQSCVSEDGHVPRQWRQDGARVLVREIPCSGKIDAQYLFHVLEAGGHGFCIVTCPPGQCSLGQGNYRADVRIRMVRRLLAEIGLEPERAEILHCASDGGPEGGGECLGELVRGAVQRLCALGESPIGRADAVRRSSA
jgi:coenzyme F420-reducing hydrogenase delta subunit